MLKGHAQYSCGVGCRALLRDEILTCASPEICHISQPCVSRKTSARGSGMGGSRSSWALVLCLLCHELPDRFEEVPTLSNVPKHAG